MENYEMTDRDFAEMAILAVIGAAAVTWTLAVTTITVTCKLANKVAGMSGNSK